MSEYPPSVGLVGELLLYLFRRGTSIWKSGATDTLEYIQNRPWCSFSSSPFCPYFVGWGVAKPLDRLRFAVFQLLIRAATGVSSSDLSIYSFCIQCAKPLSFSSMCI